MEKLNNEDIVYMRINHVAIGNEKEASKTALNDLPFELLDLVLENSYLHWTLNSTLHRRSKDVITILATVDFCWFQRMTRRKFKRRIWKRFEDYYGQTRRISAVIRNNRNYLLENIQPNNDLNASLLSLKCLTHEESELIQRQRSKQEKNAELLHVVKYFDDTKFAYFVNCLRQTNQKTMARIIENGGGVIKVTVQYRREKCTQFIEAHLLHQRVEDLRNRTKKRSYQFDKLISQLKDYRIEILSSQLKRQTVVVWIWCRSQAALEHAQMLYESNQLADILFGLGNSSLSRPSSKIIQSKVTSIDSNQFKKTVVTFPIFISFTERIDEGRGDYFICGVTKLRNKLYVLHQSYSDTPHMIFVYNQLNPFQFELKIEIKEFILPCDIVSSEHENCLYVSDREGNCVWKVKRETDDQHKIIKWLTTDFPPYILSMTTDGQLLVLKASMLMIYGSDAKLLSSIQLSSHIEKPRHAVETSIGNFIVIHRLVVEEIVRRSTKNVIWMNWTVSELTRDGQMIRRFTPSNENEKLRTAWYLSLDSDDRVFVAEQGNCRVILLDSDLKWNQIVRPTKTEGANIEEEEEALKFFERLFYDEERKQLIVGGDSHLGQGVNVYTLSRA